MIGLCSNRLKVNVVGNEILPPQTTTLYDDNATNYAFEPISGIGTANSTYSTLTSKTFHFILHNQNNESMLVSFNDKNLSNNLYTNINGFDYDLDMRFLNIDSPNIMFLPLIKATDSNTNISLNLVPIPNSINFSGVISNYNNFLSSSNLAKNDLILLTSQNNQQENCIYRVSDVLNNNVYVIQDNKINSILNSNQNKIFIRACVVDPDGERYYGLQNSSGYKWIQQTNCLKLKDCDYNLTRNSEIINNKIPIVELPSVLNVKSGVTLAISINNYGNTSGIYIIKSFDDKYIYLDPVYPEKVFVHQFCYIKQDYITSQPCIWVVNPANFDKCELYTFKKFNFIYYDISDISTDASQWAKQVGGANDTILGLTLFNKVIYDKYITTSDNFKIGVKLPSWVTNNSYFGGLSVQTKYMCEGFI